MALFKFFLASYVRFCSKSTLELSKYTKNVTKLSILALTLALTTNKIVLILKYANCKTFFVVSVPAVTHLTLELVKYTFTKRNVHPVNPQVSLAA